MQTKSTLTRPNKPKNCSISKEIPTGIGIVTEALIAAVVCLGGIFSMSILFALF